MKSTKSTPSISPSAAAAILGALGGRARAGIPNSASADNGRQGGHPGGKNKKRRSDAGKKRKTKN